MKYDHLATSHWLVCFNCGAQYPTPNKRVITTCWLCDDARQFVPATGQKFTTVGELIDTGYHNEFKPCEDSRFWSIETVPRFGAGQRAILVGTPAGNILWDCLTLIDKPTIETITRLGGVQAIVLSHPHHYTANLDWARAFGCPVYLAEEDAEWRLSRGPRQVMLCETITEIVINGVASGVRAIKLGGHFPGSLVLLYDKCLLVSDTIHITPSGIGDWQHDAQGMPRERPRGMSSFAFMWSVPNMIPLKPAELVRMWSILASWDFTSVYGARKEQSIFHRNVKGRILRSMQHQIRAMGWDDHWFLNEHWCEHMQAQEKAEEKAEGKAKQG